MLEQRKQAGSGPVHSPARALRRPAAAGLVIDVSEGNLQYRRVERSRTTPLIMDLWASCMVRSVQAAIPAAAEENRPEAGGQWIRTR